MARELDTSARHHGDCVPVAAKPQTNLPVQPQTLQVHNVPHLMQLACLLSKRFLSSLTVFTLNLIFMVFVSLMLLLNSASAAVSQGGQKFHVLPGAESQGDQRSHLRMRAALIQPSWAISLRLSIHFRRRFHNFKHILRDFLASAFLPLFS